MLHFVSMRSDHELEFEQCTEEQRKLLGVFKELLSSQNNLSQIVQFFNSNPDLMNLRIRDENGRNVFLLACEKGRTDALDLVVQRNIGLDFFGLFDCDKNSGMHLASYAGRVEVVDYLAKLNRKFLSQTHCNIYGSDPYKAAIKFNHGPAASKILSLRNFFKSQDSIRKARL